MPHVSTRFFVTHGPSVALPPFSSGLNASESVYTEPRSRGPLVRIYRRGKRAVSELGKSVWVALATVLV